MGGLVLSDMGISKRMEAVVRVGIESPSVELSASLVPSDVNATLAAHRLDWAELGGNLQRLLLWDAGYVFEGNSASVARIYTKCGSTMDDIVATRREFEQLGCPVADCNNGFAQSTEACPDSMIEQAAKCATSGVNVIADGPVWAEERANADIPEARVFRHSPRTFAIHFATATSDRSEAGSAMCEPEPRLVIPCTTFPASGSDAWCLPAPTGTVPTLLRDLVSEKQQQLTIDYPTPVVLWVVAALLAALLLLLLSALAFRILRRQPRQERGRARTAVMLAKEQSLTLMDDCVDGRESPERQYSFSVGDYSSLSVDSFSGVMMQSSRSINFDSSGPPVAVRDAGASYSDVVGASATMMAFQCNPLMLQKRVPMVDVTFTSVICRGVTCEVHLGSLHGRQVALKQLLRVKKHDPVEVERFAREIQLSAALVHEHIVQFVGVAWNSFQSMVLVLEHKDGGDLRALLQTDAARTQRPSRLSWDGMKLRAAIGIARGLAYLHSSEQRVIHRDIKSRNVLLDAATGEPALCDFGLSCRLDQVELECADSAGTMLWSAPEVIAGRAYSVKADIYSFGVVLAEIDTCVLPYKEQADADGRPLEAVRIAHMVVAGRIKPKLTASCPAYVRQIALDCLEYEPRKRPTARELVRLLSQCGPKTHVGERQSGVDDPRGTWV